MGFLESFEACLKEKCYQNDPPYCQAACPFLLDVKDLEAKWSKGRFKAAFRTYQNAVGFPGIVSEICDRPCEKACTRCKIDGPVNLGLLEKATVQYTKRKAPNAYNLPSKEIRVAVIGGGLSGLGCALRLLNRKYEVTLFEKNEILGGSARSLMDAAAFDAEIENEFQFESYETMFGREILSLDEIKDEYKAIYVATGKGGRDFGLEIDNGGAFATSTAGVFIGGELVGETKMEALASGLDAAMAIERYIKTGSMNEPFKNRKTRISVGINGVEKAEPVLPADGTSYTEEEAVAEAKRCMLCSCDACKNACDLLRMNDKTPGRLYEEVYVTIRPGTLSRDGTWATRLIASCDQCGLCKAECPQHIDIGGFLKESHIAMVEKGAMPWPYHDFWLRDMEFSSGEAKLVHRPAGEGGVKYAFFPGCNLAGSDARYVTKSYEWLTSIEPRSAIWMTCCGIPADWAAKKELFESHLEQLRNEWRALGEPIVVWACPSCKNTFDQYLPEIKGVFLQDLMAENGLVCQGRTEGIWTVFDPCAARDEKGLKESVRRILKDSGVSLEELPEEGAAGRCCGYGGHIQVAAPGFAGRVSKARTGESANAFITYCANCRESFAASGKETVHFLDLVFDLNDAKRPDTTVSEKRRQRRLAKKELLAMFGEALPEEKKAMKLEISEELERKLSAGRILTEEMEEVVAHCEKELCGVVDPETGYITGHKKIGCMTFWAVYEVASEGQCRLVNGYAHRMNLEGE